MARISHSMAALGLLASCVSDPAQELGERAAALTPVTWTDVVGASASGSDLTKTAPETTYNAGAVSVETLGNDGYVEFTTGEATTDKIAGLSVGNGGQGRADIDFGILLNASGRASVWEGGVNRGGIGPYAAGDVFRVQAEGGVVTYWRNGVLRFTSAAPPPSFPLLVDTSLRTPGATINDVAITSLVFWQNAVNASAVGNDLINTSGPSWAAGASSVESLSGDGYVEFTTGEDTEAKMAGLGTGDSGTGYADIDFAIHLNAASGVSIYESGVIRGTFGPYVPGDVFRVQVSGGVVSYLLNGVELYTSSVTPSFPLVLDTSLRTVGATILDARLVSGPIIACSPFQESLPYPGTPNLFMDAAGDVFVLSNPYYAGDGEVQVYRNTPDGWTLEQTLARGGDEDDNFGTSVATDGQTIVVGGDNPGSSGSVQVYRYDGASWVDDGLLTECGGIGFPASLDVQGDFIVAGVLSNPYFQSGRVNIYRRGPTGWRLNAVLNPPPSSFEWFGREVAIGGNRIFVSAPRRFNQAQDAGGVFVYRLDPSLPNPGPIECGPGTIGKWVQETILYPPVSVENQFFGLYGLDATSDGLRVIVGDNDFDAARIFTRSGTSWSEAATLTGYPSQNRFGHAVAFAETNDGLAALVGSYPIFSPGAAYLFAEVDGQWPQIAFIEPPEGARYFAENVAATPDALFMSDEEIAAVHIHGLDLACTAE